MVLAMMTCASVGWRYARGIRGMIVRYGVLSALARSCTLGYPLILGGLITTLESSSAVEEKISNILVLVLGYWLITILFWSLNRPSRVLEHRVSAVLSTRYQRHLMRSCYQLPLSWHKNHHSGEIIERINKGVTGLREFWTNSYIVIQEGTRLLASLGILLCWLSPPSAIVTASAYVIGVIIIRRFETPIRHEIGVYLQKLRSVASLAQDYLSNITTVISLRLSKRCSREVHARSAPVIAAVIRFAKVSERKWNLLDVTIDAGIAISLLLEGIKAAKSAVSSVSGLVQTFAYLRDIRGTIQTCSYYLGTITQHGTNIASAEYIIDACAKSGERSEFHAIDASATTIEVRGLAYHHPGESTMAHAISDCSLVLVRGQPTAVVGVSGSGKSTLLSLIRGLKRGEVSAVLVDGKQTPHGLSLLYENTALIPQDPEIFSDTIRQNITLGVQAGEQEIQDAMRLARFDEVLTRLPKGLESHVAEKGVNLSGGEKQRLALARGLFFAADAEILLLDEPTSSVDTMNETAIYKAGLAMGMNKFVVSAVHKMHLLPMFAHIVVIDGGRIVQQGGYQELLSVPGRFRELVTTQLALLGRG